MKKTVDILNDLKKYEKNNICDYNGCDVLAEKQLKLNLAEKYIFLNFCRKCLDKFQSGSVNNFCKNQKDRKWQVQTDSLVRAANQHQIARKANLN